MTTKAPIDPPRWKAIKLFAMDVDGILTDGTLRISSDGTETKVFSILDGMGLMRCHRAGIVVAWISGRESQASTIRATELKIPHLIQGRTDKKKALSELLGDLNLTADDCVYMGDDDIDVGAINYAAIGVTVPGGMPAALTAADYITTREAGHGAVREVCELLLANRGLTFVET
ncbi:MAG TPA: HAD hydrolase family protein [Opitutaceae bacterium]|nr:HAD hydrolase family protein [Opitutaceae bacterium]